MGRSYEGSSPSRRRRARSEPRRSRPAREAASGLRPKPEVYAIITAAPSLTMALSIPNMRAEKEPTLRNFILPIFLLAAIPANAFPDFQGTIHVKMTSPAGHGQLDIAVGKTGVRKHIH